MRTDEAVMAAAAQAGARYGMTAEQVMQHLALGDVPHPDAPEGVCGTTDPRDEGRWCTLGAGHELLGEEHNRYAPADGCRTWTEHKRHAPGVRP